MTAEEILAKLPDDASIFVNPLFWYTPNAFSFCYLSGPYWGVLDKMSFAVHRGNNDQGKDKKVEL